MKPNGWTFILSVSCALLGGSLFSFAAPVVLVPTNAVWKYRADGVDLGAAWQASAYDDSTWLAGAAQLGYGDGDETTIVSSGPDLGNKYITTYFRKSFTLPASPSAMTLRLLRDDGAVVYVNGTEVFRNNMPAGPIAYNTLATVSVGGIDETTYLETPISLDPFLVGNNVIAVEIHQVNTTSSDMSFALELDATLAPPGLQVSVVAIDTEAREISPLLDIPENPAVFRVSRTGPTNTALGVGIRMSGTASNGVDYSFVSNVVSIPAGSAFADVFISVLDDTLVEGTESVILTLIPTPCLECYVVSSNSSATAYILDNEPTNSGPKVSILSPADGVKFTLPTNILLRASASDPEDGNDILVEFYVGTLRIGTATFVPTLCPSPECPYYAFVWSNAPAGTLPIFAIATDKAGAHTVSAPVNITVSPATNQPPVVTILNPTNGAVVAFPTSIFVLMGVHDADGLARNATVQMFANNQSLGYAQITDPGPEHDQAFRFIWTNAQPGSYILTAQARDEAGAFFEASVQITVLGDLPRTNLTLVPTGSVWKYLDNGTDQGTAWRASSFDDSFWPQGPAQLGYGDGDEVTVVGFGPDPANKYVTTFFRRAFSVPNPAAISNLVVRLLRDDGGVVYLNGNEVFRSNMPDGIVDYRTLAVTTVGGPDETTQFYSASIPPSLLLPGRNVLAVEIHQVNVPSSDLSFDLELTATTGPDSTNQSPSIGITSPTNGATFTVPSSIFLLATLQDADGVAANGTVEFFANAVSLGQAQLTDPGPLHEAHFRLLWTNALAGNYTLTAKGTDAQGAVTFSAPVVITINPAAANNAPFVQLNQPIEGQAFTAPATVLLRAFAHDPEDLYKLKVEFFAGEMPLGLGSFVGTTCPSPYCPCYGLTWSNVPPGNYTLTARATDSSGLIATSAPVRISVQQTQPPPAQHELHAIGVYSGNYNGGSSPHHEQGQASILVNRPGTGVTLFLSAYEPVLWHIAATNGTLIEKVILGGYYRQAIDGLPAGVPVVTRYYDEGAGSSDYLWSGYSIDNVEFLRTVSKLCDLTGMDLSSFQGAYTAPAPTPFVIAGVQSDPRLRCNYPQPVDPAALPPIAFDLSFLNLDGVTGFYTRHYTLAGPQNGGRLLPGMNMVSDQSGQSYYGTESQYVYKYDSEGGVSLVDLGSVVPAVSIPTGVGFDSTRNRVLLVSLGGEGYLYGYATADQQWSVISSMNNRDANGIVYHPASDSIYAVSTTYDDSQPRVLWQLNSSGQFLGQIPLPQMPFNFSSLEYQTILVSAGDYLVLLVEPAYRSFYGTSQAESRIYLIDPRTSQVWLTYRKPLLRDGDDDGVPDDQDQCPNTPRGELVDAHGCGASQQDSDHDGVPNNLDRCPNTPMGEVVNAQGCGISQLCPCEQSWRNHNEYVQCVSTNATQFLIAGLISESRRNQIVQLARDSSCGRRHPRLIVPPQQGEAIRASGCNLLLDGDGPVTCVIECSEDLLQWRPISTNLLDGIQITITDTDASSAPRRFYRIQPNSP
jgi:hypothetical protein